MYLQCKGKLFRGKSLKVKRISLNRILNGHYSVIFTVIEVHYLNKLIIYKVLIKMDSLVILLHMYECFINDYILENKP